MSLRIGLIRHGPTGWNGEGRIQGRIDQPLTPEARAEYGALRLPPEWRAARIIASPLKRARETAELIAPGAFIDIEPRLIEQDWGAWEGARGVDLLADPDSGFRPIEEWGWNFTPPGGESLGAVRARLRAALADIASGARDALIVSHIGVMRVMLALAAGWSFTGPAPFRVKRKRIYPLLLDKQGAVAPNGPPERLIS